MYRKLKNTYRNKLLQTAYLASFLDIQFSSVAQLCLTLCDPIDRSTPGLPVHHQLPEFTQTHGHPTISSSAVPFSSCPQSFPPSGSFQMSKLFASGGQSTGVAASTSVELGQYKIQIIVLYSSEKQWEIKNKHDLK